MKCGLRFKGMCAVPGIEWPKNGKCPRYRLTDDNCNIIPAKRKPVKALVRIKAWARYSKSYNGLTAIEDTSDMSPINKKPCFILIDKKHLKGE